MSEDYSESTCIHVPFSKNEAGIILTDNLRRQFRAGIVGLHLRQAGLQMAAAWPETVRPSVEEIEKCVGYVSAPVAVIISEALPTPMFASERLLAERLSAGSLRQVMRYVTGGPDAGWRAWSGDSWAECRDAVPQPFAAEVHREVGNLLGGGLLDQRMARQMETTASMRGVLLQVSAYPQMQLDQGSIDPPGRLPTVGGLLDLEGAGSVDVSNPASSLFLRCAAVGYDPAATHELWDDV